jgi:hypothetical protein
MIEFKKYYAVSAVFGTGSAKREASSFFCTEKDTGLRKEAFLVFGRTISLDRILRMQKTKFPVIRLT